MEINYVGIVISFFLMMAIIFGLYWGLKKIIPASAKGKQFNTEHPQSDQMNDDGERPQRD